MSKFHVFNTVRVLNALDDLQCCGSTPPPPSPITRRVVPIVETSSDWISVAATGTFPAYPIPPSSPSLPYFAALRRGAQKRTNPWLGPPPGVAIGTALTGPNSLMPLQSLTSIQNRGTQDARPFMFHFPVGTVIDLTVAVTSSVPDPLVKVLVHGFYYNPTVC